MSYFIPSTIGNGAIQGNINPVEYTSGTVASTLQVAFNNLNIILQGVDAGNASANAGPATTNLQNLLNLFALGGTDGDHMTIGMSNAVDALLQSFNIVGIQVSQDPTTKLVTINPPITGNQLLTWKNLAAFTPEIQQALSIGVNIMNSNRSLQSMVELNYVANGNNILAANLEDLEKSLKATQTSIDTLTSLQQIHNQLGVQNTTFTASSFAGSSTAYANAYINAASAYFAQPIAPLLSPNLYTDMSGNTVTNQWNQLSTLYSGKGGVFGAPDFTVASYYAIPAWAAYTAYASGVLENVAVAGPGTVTYTLPSTPPTVPGYPTITSYPPDFLSHFGFTQNVSGQWVATVSTGSSEFQDLVNGNLMRVANTLGYISFSAPSGAPSVAILAVVPGTPTTAALAADPNVGAVQFTKLNQFASYSTVTHSLAVGGPSTQMTSLTTAINQLISLRKTVSAQIAILSGQTAALSGGGSDPNTLLGRLKVVYQDLNRVFTSNGTPISTTTSISAAYSGFSNWILDNYGGRFSSATSQQAGVIQQNITYAITAAQSLNDQQKEDVRNQLYIFDQFYQSASSILTNLTQIIERIAQSISRG